jgi:hypothetical protein
MLNISASSAQWAAAAGFGACPPSARLGPVPLHLHQYPFSLWTAAQAAWVNPEQHMAAAQRLCLRGSLPPACCGELAHASSRGTPVPCTSLLLPAPCSVQPAVTDQAFNHQTLHRQLLCREPKSLRPIKPARQ